MAQTLRTLAVLPEALSSIPSNHMVVHNHLRDLMPSSGMQVYMQTEHSYILYICVCVYICMCIYIYIYTYTHIYMYTHTHTHFKLSPLHGGL
jgi:dolichyl-phosphate-mannose--protein O-mannosyl transferase